MHGHSNIEDFVKSVLASTADEREQLMFDLISEFKRLEDESPQDLAAAEQYLPALCIFLMDENQRIAGCAISIFRRVKANASTVARLLELLSQHLNDLVIEALGRVDPAEWNSDIESALADVLSRPIYQTSLTKAGYNNVTRRAAEALYYHADQICHQKTISVLASALFANDDSTSRFAARTLVRSTKFAGSQASLDLLDDVLSADNSEIKVTVVDYLGYETDRGLPLLQKTAQDPNADVRIATIKSLVRGYMTQPNGKSILQNLTQDRNKKVAAEATLALAEQR